MKLIIGLGNPGPQYELTRHNIGFLVIDQLVDKIGIENTQKEKFNGLYYSGQYKTTPIHVLKPTTYMNLSGKSVIKAMQFYKVDPKDTLIIYDDFDQDFGKIRLRAKGSGGTHNGMNHIIEQLGHNEIPRLRMGIGPKPTGLAADKYVLSPFNTTEMDALEEFLGRGVGICENWVSEGIDSAMQRITKNS